MHTRRFAMLGAALLLAGCMGDTGGQPTVSAPAAYTVSKVTLKLAEGATVKGRFEDKALRDSVLARVSATATEYAKSKPGGAQNARAIVSVTEMQLKGADGRSFGGVNAINGQMSIVASNGTVLKGPVPVRYFDQAKNTGASFNGIPIGLLINAGRNSADQESGADVDTLIKGFATQVVAGF
ncbi:hypothetical protein [Pseudosulfitobacter sp. SM2401]|uniref:hypothetical protein n=1 Tax=Pseudosulfitobacter sp. SM2401 TaxID=3350098 RepID=UPI0036F34962